MHALALLLATAVVAPLAGGAEHVATGASRPAENLLAGPARCVLRYLDAVRLAGPRPALAVADRFAGRVEQEYRRAKELTAPRTLEEIQRRASRGEDHPLAPWREAARARVLESFQLVAVRRAPRGAAVVTVNEAFWRGASGDPLAPLVSEYLVARVEGRWRVVDRRAGGAFDDEAVASNYAGFFDEPAPVR